MATIDYHSHPYIRQINEYQTELAMLRDAVDHILDELEGPKWMTSTAHILQGRFSHLVESFPFPSEDQIAAHSPILPSP